ncbi:MAG TPA: hypothetical protein VFQ18_08730 [Candidatus Acidoferrum sp.]|nr:hypothetical protein [Candidatus Acidoferrum sp.]
MLNNRAKSSPLPLAARTGTRVARSVIHSNGRLPSQLTIAGADARLLSVLAKAKILPPAANAQQKRAPELLQHLALAAKLLRTEQYPQAAEELNSALESGAGPEAGFVMGEVLRRQEQWSMSVSVYQAVLQKDPAFPEVHTKLSYLFHRLGASEESLREAKAALARTPGNAEAYK